MPLPLTLPSGMILVYGLGTEQSPNGLVPSNTIFRFGTVYQIWSGGEVFVYGGDTVMFKEENVVCRLAVGGDPNDIYSLLPARLVTKQILPP